MLILLADDERMVRIGLQSMLEELYPHVHTFLHASNGHEVIKIIKKFHPDLTFLDVKMPLLSGLEALAECKNISPSTTWVILSGYADFDFARQALSLSAYEYILKPIDIKTLELLYRRIIDSKKKTLMENNTAFANDVIRSFNMADQFGAEDTEFLPVNKENYILYQIYINKTKTQHYIKQQLCETIKFFSGLENGITNYCLFFNTLGNLCFICITKDASRVTNLMSSIYKKFDRGSFSIFYGNSNTIKGLYQISLRIQKIAGIRLLYSHEKALLISNIEVIPHLSKMLAFYDAFERLTDYYITNDIGSFKQLLSDYEKNKEMEEIFSIIDRHLFYLYLTDLMKYIFTADTYRGFIREIMSCLSILHADALNINNSDISKIKDFIYKNYSKDVSIAYVSECFNLSPTYFSRLFHEKTGQKYIDFVTEIRMEQAKNILKEAPGISVKQVSESVGYSSVRHFSKTFQRYTGVLPSSFHLLH